METMRIKEVARLIVVPNEKDKSYEYFFLNKMIQLKK
jgi:hypothetical protein